MSLLKRFRALALPFTASDEAFSAERNARGGAGCFEAFAPSRLPPPAGSTFPIDHFDLRETPFYAFTYVLPLVVGFGNGCVTVFKSKIPVSPSRTKPKNTRRNLQSRYITIFTHRPYLRHGDAVRGGQFASSGAGFHRKLTIALRVQTQHNLHAKSRF